MSGQLKIIILVNAVLVVLFVFFNWVGYEILNIGRALSIQAYFPIYLHGQTVRSPLEMGWIEIILPNYLLVIFLISTTVNLYFIFKLQRNKKPVT